MLLKRMVNTLAVHDVEKVGSNGLGNQECEKQILLSMGSTPSKRHTEGGTRLFARIPEIHTGTAAG